MLLFYLAVSYHIFFFLRTLAFFCLIIHVLNICTKMGWKRECTINVTKIWKRKLTSHSTYNVLFTEVWKKKQRDTHNLAHHIHHCGFQGRQKRKRRPCTHKFIFLLDDNHVYSTPSFAFTTCVYWIISSWEHNVTHKTFRCRSLFDHGYSSAFTHPCPCTHKI